VANRQKYPLRRFYAALTPSLKKVPPKFPLPTMRSGWNSANKSKEQDPEELLEITIQINRLLREKDEPLKNLRQPIGPANSSFP